MNKTRSDITKEESTVNPIFLFQKGTLKIHSETPIEYNHDLEEMVDLDGKFVSDQKILDEGYGYIQWTTEHVWATREEAEEWGKTHAYRYRASDGKDGVQGKDWNVYCISCCGSLSSVLDDSKPKECLEWGESVQ